MKETRDFRGRGWKFPIRFGRDTVEMLSGNEDIENSLDILFSTQVGERVMHPNYGTALSGFAFSPMNKTTLTYMQSIISDEILYNEPRINVRNIDIRPSISEEGRLDIDIEYVVNATNNRYNYVFPFYIREATNLQR
jgi:phage baseplate assembly protein W